MQKHVQHVRSIVLVFIFLDVILVARGQFQPNFEGQSPRQGGLQNDPGPLNGAGPPTGAQRGINSRNNERLLRNPFNNKNSQNSENSKGICRDGWVEANMNNALVCIYVNKNELSWDEAKDSCRDNYAFLLKLEAPLTVKQDNIKDFLRKQNIENLWTGLHEENDLFAWDELAPHKVRPYNDYLALNSAPKRIWDWDISDEINGTDVCGELDISNIESDDESLVRKRRAPEEQTENGDMFSFAKNSKESDPRLNPTNGFMMNGMEDPFLQLRNFQNGKTNTMSNFNPSNMRQKSATGNIALLQKAQAAEALRDRILQNGDPFGLQQEVQENLREMFPSLSEAQEPQITADRIRRNKEKKNEDTEQAFKEIGLSPFEKATETGTSRFDGLGELQHKTSLKPIEYSQQTSKMPFNSNFEQLQSQLRSAGNLMSSDLSGHHLENLQRQLEGQSSDGMGESIRNTVTPSLDDLQRQFELQTNEHPESGNTPSLEDSQRQYGNQQPDGSSDAVVPLQPVHLQKQLQQQRDRARDSDGNTETVTQPNESTNDAPINGDLESIQSQLGLSPGIKNKTPLNPMPGFGDRNDNGEKRLKSKENKKMTGSLASLLKTSEQEDAEPIPIIQPPHNTVVNTQTMNPVLERHLESVDSIFEKDSLDELKSSPFNALPSTKADLESTTINNIDKPVAFTMFTTETPNTKESDNIATVSSITTKSEEDHSSENITKTEEKDVLYVPDVSTLPAISPVAGIEITPLPLSNYEATSVPLLAKSNKNDTTNSTIEIYDDNSSEYLGTPNIIGIASTTATHPADEKQKRNVTADPSTLVETGFTVKPFNLLGAPRIDVSNSSTAPSYNEEDEPAGGEDDYYEEEEEEGEYGNIEKPTKEMSNDKIGGNNKENTTESDDLFIVTPSVLGIISTKQHDYEELEPYDKTTSPNDLNENLLDDSTVANIINVTSFSSDEYETPDNHTTTDLYEDDLDFVDGIANDSYEITGSNKTDLSENNEAVTEIDDAFVDNLANDSYEKADNNNTDLTEKNDAIVEAIDDIFVDNLANDSYEVAENNKTDLTEMKKAFVEEIDDAFVDDLTNDSYEMAENNKTDLVEKNEAVVEAVDDAFDDLANDSYENTESNKTYLKEKNETVVEEIDDAIIDDEENDSYKKVKSNRTNLLEKNEAVVERMEEAFVDDQANDSYEIEESSDTHLRDRDEDIVEKVGDKFDEISLVNDSDDFGDLLDVEKASLYPESQTEDQELPDDERQEFILPENIREKILSKNLRFQEREFSSQIQRTKVTMKLSECKVRRPSVCYSPAITVDPTASTCPDGWHGHIFIDKCYKVIISAMSFAAAGRRCSQEGGSLANMDSLFHERLVLMTIRKSMQDGLVVGTQSAFWVLKQASNGLCVALTVNGFLEVSCNTPAEVVCERPVLQLPAKGLSTEKTDDEQDDSDTKHITLSIDTPNNTLNCGLTGTAKELPTVWFKDGQLVDIRVQERSESLMAMLGVNGRPISPLPEPALTATSDLEMNTMLRKTLEYSASHHLSDEMFQGTYWCEVWNISPFKRRRSNSYNVRYADVITFKGSVEVPNLSREDALLHNMINKENVHIKNVMTDVKRIHESIFPALSKNLPKLKSTSTFGGELNKKNPNILNYNAFLRMSDNYSTAEENMAYILLRRQLREVMRNTKFLLTLPGGTPLHVIRTIHIKSTVACPMTRLHDDVTGYSATFPRSSTNFIVNSVEICEGQVLGSAKCKGGYSDGAYWDEVKIHKSCNNGSTAKPPLPVQTRDDDDEEEEEEEPDGDEEDRTIEKEHQNQTDDEEENEDDGSVFETMSTEDRLKELAEMTMEDDNVESIMEETADIVEHVSEMTALDVDYIADIMDKTVNVKTITRKVGENIMKTMDKVLKIDEDEIERANKETAATNRIVRGLEKCAENIYMDDGNIRLVQPNVAMEVWKFNSMTAPIIGMAAKHGKGRDLMDVFRDERIYTIYNRSQLYDDVDAAIELPPELIKDTLTSSGNDDTRLYMIVYRDGRLFKGSSISSGDSVDVTFDSSLGRLNSYVISASIGGKKIQGLMDKVKTVFKPLQNAGDEKRTCAFWDFALNDKYGGWSSEGCVYDGQMNGRDICLCDHLTNFAVLIDFYGQAEPIPDHHEFSLSIISLVGLSLSILGLSLTIISYVFFKKLRQGRAQQTLFNLALAMLCSWVVFLTGIRQTHNYVGCILVAVLLHYFILASFMWMLMEAFLQYLTFVKVLGTYVTRYTLKTVIVAWGVPLIPIIVVLSVDYTLYRGGDRYCWMALPAFYYAFAAPIGLIILCNLAVFIITVYSICNRPDGLRSNQSKQKIALTNLQAAITSFVLLGLTWLLGYLAISDARLVFQYAFTILNTLQGFFIFVLFVARKKQVRDQWLIACCCKTPKQEKASRSLSASASIPSTCSGRSSYSGRSERSDSTKTTTSFMNDFDSIYTLPYARHSRESLYYRKEDY